MTNVRSARLPDAGRIAELSKELGYPASTPEIAARLEALLGSADHCVLVAEEGGEVVAWLHATVARTIESAPKAEVRGLVVDARFRRRGVGPLLLAAAEAWARGKGAARLRVPCNVTRADAHRFYRREGFREAKVQTIFERDVTET
jgi:GNAT superfamily N-acetyltransferase